MEEITVHEFPRKETVSNPPAFTASIPSLSLCEFCEANEKKFLSQTSEDCRKEHGQFFTPSEIARFMAFLGETSNPSVRLLDPGAGTGILSCAVCELAVLNGVSELHIDAYESDSALVQILRKTLEHASKTLQQYSVTLTYRIFENDFILKANEVSGKDRYDLIISNPPYFKINKNDPRAIAASEFVHGQPNIYALFMGTAMHLLRDDGIMVFITPRSYASGPYFKLFRTRFFEKMTPQHVHVFNSRKEAFNKHSVLQENIILKAKRTQRPGTVHISSSNGATGILASGIYDVPLNQVLVKKDDDIILRLPTSAADEKATEIVDSWSNTLSDYDLGVSTGPVVGFRASQFISSAESQSAVPMLWMRNVRAMVTNWPGNNQKPNFILNNSLSKKLLVRNRNYVLIRRFSAKEQPRRLTAAPLLKEQLCSEFVGLENHLNYLYKKDGELTEDETLGISAILNSSLMDRYIRVSNGNTQVSATELRSIPLPPYNLIVELGRKIRASKAIPTLEQMDALLANTLKTDIKVQLLRDTLVQSY